MCDRSLQVTLLRQASPQLKSARQRARDRASPQSRSAMLHRRNDSAQTGRCPVHLRVGKRGLDRQRCLLLGHRACQVTRLCELVAEVVARISIRWPRWECATVMRDGLGRPAILSEHNAKVVVGDVRHAVELQNPTPQHLGVLNDSEQREKRLSRMRPRLLLPRANGVAPSTRRKRCRAQPRSSRRTSATVKESSTAAHRAVPGRTARPTSTDRTRRRTPKLPVCRATPAEAAAAARRPTTRQLRRMRSRMEPTRRTRVSQCRSTSPPTRRLADSPHRIHQEDEEESRERDGSRLRQECADIRHDGQRVPAPESRAVVLCAKQQQHGRQREEQRQDVASLGNPRDGFECVNERGGAIEGPASSIAARDVVELVRR